jgi:hypothetical protein
MQSVNNFKFKSIPLDLSGMAFDMAEGSLTEIKEIFFIEGKYAPIIRWCSFPQNDWPKPHQIICEYWRNNFNISKFNLNDLDANDTLAKVKPYLALLSKKDTEFDYSFIGQRFADFHGISVKNNDGLLKSLERNQTAIALLDYTTVMATAIRGQGILSLYQGGTETAPLLWNKLILPLTDDKGIAEKFVICALRSPSN